MMLIDERVSTIVLPSLPPDHEFVDEEEDELIFAEEVEDQLELESASATPLRVFLGSSGEIEEKNLEEDGVSHIWDLSSMVADEDEDAYVFDDDDDDLGSLPPPPPIRSQPSGLATLNTASLPVEESFSEYEKRTTDSGSSVSSPEASVLASMRRAPALASLSNASLPVEENTSSDESLEDNAPSARIVPPPRPVPRMGLATLDSARMPIEESSEDSPPDYKRPAGLATLNMASLPIEENSGFVDLSRINPDTPIHDLDKNTDKGPFFGEYESYDSEYETEEDTGLNVRAVASTENTYLEEEFSEADLEEIEDFYDSGEKTDSYITSNESEFDFKPTDSFENRNSFFEQLSREEEKETNYLFIIILVLFICIAIGLLILGLKE